MPKADRYVRNPKKAEWGIGRVIEEADSKLKVAFEFGGVRTLSTQIVVLEEVAATDAPTAVLASVPNIDVAAVLALCQRFILDMKANRSGFNDSGVAEKIAEEIQSKHRLTRTTAKRLAAWCNTEGAVFQAGVDTARAISVQIFGRILSEEEF